MLSVIIPTLNAHSELSRLLTQLGGVADEVVVSDGGSIDNTLAVAHGAQARIALGCKGRGWQMARGARWSTGQDATGQDVTGQDANDWFLFLHADTVLPSDWFEHIQAHIENFPRHAGVFKFKFDHRGFWPKYIEIWVALRCAIFALPYGDQGLLIRRDLYDTIGGFADIVLFEDVDIIRKLGRKRIKTIPAFVITSAQRYRENGYVRRGLSNIGLILRYFLGAHPTQLARKYNK